MANDKKDKERSQIPPPLDPFPTYQTPYSRSSTSADENPFIQFRRFADQQFSSLFNSLGLDFPSVFGHGDWSFSDKESEMWNKSREAKAEGFRKEWEQRIEEMRAEQERRGQETLAWFGMKPSTPQDIAELQARLDRTVKRLEDQGNGNAAKPAQTVFQKLEQRTREIEQRNRETEQRDREIKQRVREAGTELDLYEMEAQPGQRRQAWSGKCQRREQDKSAKIKQESTRPKPLEKKATDCTRGALGHDGRHLLKAFHNAETKPANNTVGYNQWQGRPYDPAGNPEHTMPWLLLDPYSPIHICNPEQDRLIAANFEQSVLTPVNVSNMSYRTPVSTDTDRQMSKVLPWGDAFEDLMGLETTGKMAERNFSTRGTPDDWIAGMVGRGVLRGWQLDGQGRMIRGAEKNEIESTKVPEQSPISAATKSSPQPAEPYSATEIVAAIEKARETRSRPRKVDAPPQQVVKPNEKSEAKASNPSKSSWSLWDGAGNDNDHVVSIVTNTERRPLPDGSIQIKTSFKKKYADGREESRQRVEHENIPREATSRQAGDRALAEARDIATQLKQLTSKEHFKKVQAERKSKQSSEQTAEEQHRGGWFWR